MRECVCACASECVSASTVSLTGSFEMTSTKTNNTYDTWTWGATNTNGVCDCTSKVSRLTVELVDAATHREGWWDGGGAELSGSKH